MILIECDLYFVLPTCFGFLNIIYLMCVSRIYSRLPPISLLFNSIPEFFNFGQLSLLLLVVIVVVDVVVVVVWQKRILFDIIFAVCNFIFEPAQEMAWIGEGSGESRLSE